MPVRVPRPKVIDREAHGSRTMLLDVTQCSDALAMAKPAIVHGSHDWTILIPFFNEEDYLAATIESLAAQTRTARLILIDNGSTDASAATARATCERLGLDHLLLTERRPGKVQALQTGLVWVHTPYVATCDADTYYPANYLEAAETLLRQDGCVVAGAYWAAADSDAAARMGPGRLILTQARALPHQCHTGGAGECFRTEVLIAAGGFDPAIWGYVLEDHEIVHRMMRYGTMRYAMDLWCAPSPRKRDRVSIRWTLFERLAYSACAPRAGDWFFYRFLGPRLARRRLMSSSIREQVHQTAEPLAAPALAAAQPALA
ncbi:glycosyltransferase family 2 protein [Sphingomonas pseudosanguinis]|uniref:Glycosyltransferase involved in cell wall biosynthesis n=1 Tax=Sphingomonas pseudosanguinis TaxID=413712 RepID=A0A7W6ABZ1_9SPHN|nr:glycosyltransferase family A protein [Sphingomonas pseudosanguinis]MBB3881087.1 glycosyltransferase involved in cell wall biosynthesis [Sphingomonas pseudosanguinis]